MIKYNKSLNNKNAKKCEFNNCINKSTFKINNNNNIILYYCVLHKEKYENNL